MMTTTIPQMFLEPPYLLIKPDASEDDFYRYADEDFNAEFLNRRIVRSGSISSARSGSRGPRIS